MADSTAESLLTQCARCGHAELRFAEASQLCRAMGFILGWPKTGKWLVRGVYWTCDLIERIVRLVLPRRSVGDLHDRNPD